MKNDVQGKFHEGKTGADPQKARNPGADPPSSLTDGERGEWRHLKEGYDVLALHMKQLHRLLENAFEQNRLLVAERKTLWTRIRMLQIKRRDSRERNADLLVHLLQLVLGDGDVRTVERLSVSIARDMGLGAQEIWRLQQAARLHRMGLLYVPDAQRQRKGLCFSATLDKTLVQVPLASAHMMEALDGMAGVASVLKQLGERYDGSGEPEGLKGKGILPESRILAAVLAYQNLRSEGLGASEALGLLGGQAGWDPQVLAALMCHGEVPGEAFIRIRIWDLAPGMVLATPVHARAGAMLLPAGTCITAHHLEQLLAYSGAGPLEEMVSVYPPGRESLA